MDRPPAPATARRVARNTGVQVVGEALSKLASLAFYLVFARVAGPGDFGDLVFAMSLALLMTVLAGFGVEGLIVRGVARDAAVAPRLLTDAIALKVVSGTIGVLGAVGVSAVAGYTGDVRLAVAIFAVSAVLDLITKSFYAIFQALDDMRPVASCMLVQRSATAAVGIALALAGAPVSVVALAFLGGSVLGLGLARAWLGRRGVSAHRRPSASGAWALARDSFALGLNNVFATVLFRGDATMLSLMKGSAAVGLYGVAYRLLESTFFLSYAFTAALVPTFSRLTRETTPSISRAFELGCKILALLLIPIGDLLVAYPEAIVHTLFGDGYEGAEPVLRLLGGAAVLYGFAYLAGYLLVSQNRERVLPWTSGLVALQNIALNLALIPALSYKGAALSTTISEATRTAALLYHSVRATGPLRLWRIVLAPAAGTVGIAAVALGAGTSLPALPLALAAYAGCAYLVERRLFPDDLELIRDAVRRRRPATQAPDPEPVGAG